MIDSFVIGKLSLDHRDPASSVSLYDIQQSSMWRRYTKPRSTTISGGDLANSLGVHCEQTTAQLLGIGVPLVQLHRRHEFRYPTQSVLPRLISGTCRP